MRSLIVLALLAAVGCKSAPDYVYLPPAVAVPDELPSLPFDVAALDSAPWVRRAALRRIDEAIEKDVLLLVSKDPRILHAVSPATFTESARAVEAHAQRLVERGDVEAAIWDLERAGSTSPLLPAARALHAKMRRDPHPELAEPFEYGELPDGFTLLRTECVAAGVTILQAQGCERTWLLGFRDGAFAWKRDLGASGALAFKHVVRGPRVFFALLDRVFALDAETGAIAWSFQRRSFEAGDETAGDWVRGAPEVTFRLNVTLDVVELERGFDYPIERLDPRTGELRELKLGARGTAVPVAPAVPPRVQFG